MLDEVVRVLVYGVATGAGYALLALGFTLIYGVGRILNLGYTGFYMIGAYMFVLAADTLGLDLLSAIVFAVILTFLLGTATYRVAVQPVEKYPLTVLIVTVALALVFQWSMHFMARIVFGTLGSGEPKPAPTIWPGFMEVLGIRIESQTILAGVASAILVLIVWMFVSKSKIGRAVQAVAQDTEAAALVGVNVSRIKLLTMGLSAALAATYAVFTAPNVEPTIWIAPLIVAFSVTVFGGLGSIQGTVVAALVIGLAENAVVFLVPGGSFLRLAVTLIILVLTLQLRPSGIFGKHIET